MRSFVFLFFFLVVAAMGFASRPSVAATKTPFQTNTSTSAPTVPFINAGTASDGTTSSALGVQVNGTERMRVTATGSVGIGTTAPSTALDVIGTVKATAFSGGGIAIPSGAVMAFNLSSCPEGWSVFSAGAGRLVVGVGQGNTGETGGAGTERTLLATGGAETHTLTLAEMPSHDHGGVTGTETGATSSIAYFAGGVVGVNGGGTYTYFGGGSHTHSISPQGGGQAHPIMPPFIALLFCQKD